MDKYVLLVLLLTPGFIASMVASFCGNFFSRHTEFGYVMRYFTYSFFVLAISMLVAYCTGHIDGNSTWNDIISSITVVDNSLAFMAISLIAAVAVGMIWPLYLRDLFLRLCNAIKFMITGRTTIYANRIIDDVFCGDKKQKPILVELCKGDKSILGFMESIGSADNDDLEFSILNVEGYREWLDTDECHVIRTYVNVDKGITLKQYSYPSEWLEEQV